MSSVVISGNTSGTITLDAPAVAGTTTLTLPATTGNIVTDSATQTLTNKTLTSPTITGALVSSMASSVITSGTAVASTSGTSIDFTSIPSWVKRITVMFSGVSTNGNSFPLIQIGDLGGIETTDYNSASSNLQNATTVGVSSSSAGFLIAFNVSTYQANGHIIITNIDGNNWIASGSIGSFTGRLGISTLGGSKTLSDTLTQIRITTVNGTDTFDAGSINILFE
jgi:hypothetical protein